MNLWPFLVDLIQLMLDELKMMDFMLVSDLFFFSLITNNYWVVVDASLFYPFEKAYDHMLERNGTDIIIPCRAIGL